MTGLPSPSVLCSRQDDRGGGCWDIAPGPSKWASISADWYRSDALPRTQKAPRAAAGKLLGHN